MFQGNSALPLMPYHLEEFAKQFNGGSSTSGGNGIIKVLHMDNTLVFKKSDGTRIIVDLSSPGTDIDTVDYILTQGAWVNTGYASSHSNRVCTKDLVKGKFYVKAKSGYVIRAVYSYSSADGGTGSMDADTSTTRTEYTSNNDSLYYGVTFAKTDANADISPSEGIVAEWYFTE